MHWLSATIKGSHKDRFRIIRLIHRTRQILTRESHKIVVDYSAGNRTQLLELRN